MKNINDLVELSKEYDRAFDKSNERIQLWVNTKFTETFESLNRIRQTLEQGVSFYKSNLYLDGNITSWAEGLTLRCGSQRIIGGSETGFAILFTAIGSGRIVVLAFKHFINDSSNVGEEIGLYEPEELEYDKIVDIVYQAISKVQKSSRLFIGD